MQTASEVTPLTSIVLKHGADMKDIGFTEGFHKGYYVGRDSERELLWKAYKKGVISEEVYDAIVDFKNEQN